MASNTDIKTSNTPKEIIEESLYPQGGLLFRKDSSGPIFCKPKLIPLKSVTLEKLEMMQQEGLEKMRQMERQKLEDEQRITSDAESGEPVDVDANVPKQTDVWQAD